MNNRIFEDCLGKRTLILGELATGKTMLTVKLIREAAQLGYASEITIIDLAPKTLRHKGRKIGGRIEEYIKLPDDVSYLAPERIETPRLRAKSADELLSLVRLNRERIEPLFKAFIRDPTEILFINDLSIYLQSGSADSVLSVAKAAETFIANAYYGESLAFDHGTKVSENEKTLTELVSDRSDVVVRL